MIRLWLISVVGVLAVSAAEQSRPAPEAVSQISVTTPVASRLDGCPQNDSAYNTIRSDFQILRDGAAVTGNIACSEPVSQMPLTQFSDELVMLEVFRLGYYMDLGRSNYLPWTSLRLYDWLKTKIAGVNIHSSDSGVYCCDSFGGKLYYAVSATTDAFNQRYKLTLEGIADNLALAGHEARHVDGFPHDSGCGIPNGCDYAYNEANLSPYGIQYWLFRAWLNGVINIGFACLPGTRPSEVANTFLADANGYIDRFDTTKPPLVVMPAQPGGPCLIESSPTQPLPASLMPPVSNGNIQTFTVAYSAPGGYQTLDVVNVLINNALDGHQACYLAYARASNVLYIVADNGDATQITGSVMNGSGTVGNSQCTVSLAGSSATGAGNTLTLVLDVSFAASFYGNKVVYAAARDLAQNNSGWKTMGVHAVPPLPSNYPAPVSIAPSSGYTLTPTFTFTYQDLSSASNLQTVWALINTAVDGRQACYVAYYRPGNQLYLFPDNGDGSRATNIVLSGNNTIGNSQCTVTASGASVQANGNILTVTLPITFKTPFAGFKGAWLAAQTIGGVLTSPWTALGAVVVPSQQ